MRPKSKRPYSRHGDSTPVVKIKRAPGELTKTQRRAAAAAEVRAGQQRWRTSLISVAGTTWSKLHPQELAKVDGNIHVLAGLVQMRYQLSREESDRQVKGFFDKHAAPVVVPVAAAAAVAVPEAK